MSSIDLVADIVGDKQLIRRLKRLEKKGQNAAARKALGKGMTVTANAMRQAAPVGEKKMVKKSIGKKLKKNKKTGLHESRVGINIGKKRRPKGTPITGKGASKFQSPHAHLVALGTKPRVHKKTGKSVGSVPPNPFVKRAFAATRAKAMRTVKKWLRIGIEEQARKG